MDVSQLVDLSTMVARLNEIFERAGLHRGRILEIERQPQVYASSYRSEIVVCTFEDQTELTVLCKYEDESVGPYDDRRGVAYEADVYRHVLRPLKVSTPAFYGSFTDPESDRTVLVLEYLDGSLRLSKIAEMNALGMGAEWIGRFHALTEVYLAKAVFPTLTTYDSNYFIGWVRRTSLFAGELGIPWLLALCSRFEEAIDLLLGPRPTIIHGEFYPHNVLIRNGSVHPLDWESAAIGAGEIDLAALTDRWEAESVRRAELDYQRTRWPGGAPGDFDRILTAARMYLHFRWLGYEREWTHHQSSRERFDQLRSDGERLGLI